ncbi:MAG: RNA polymerase sigma-70 factor [Ginsengibacter sp.]
MSLYKNIPETVRLNTCDEQLLQQMAGGDRQAFTELYKRYWEDLFITSAKALRGKEAAADVVQDVFLSLWNRRNELKLQGSIAAYLHTSVRYKCIHYIEKNTTRRDYLVQLAEVAINNSSPNAEINLQLKEMQRTIKNSVAKMPPKMQEVYKLSRQEHLSYKEISDYMSISVETVKKHIQHALQLIRKDLGPYIFILIILTFFCLG